MRVVVIALAVALTPLAPLTLASCASTPTTADQRAAGPFVDELAPYGDWWWRPGVGWVFSPYVGAGWAPYTHGRWGWSALDGWAWLSDEPFGWATYHYGRWLVVDNRWAWLPGDVWAPAWVDWRHGPGFVGWAPVGARHWVFVRDAHFLEPSLARRVLPREVTDEAFARTRVVHRPMRDVDGRVLNPGVSPRVIGRATGRPVPSIDDEASMRRVRLEDEARARAIVEKRDPVAGHLRARDFSRNENAFGGELERERAKQRAVDDHKRRAAMERARERREQPRSKR